MMCPNCRAWSDSSGDPSRDRYCRMCGADTVTCEPDAPATPEPEKPKVNLAQLESYWEGDVAHWLRNGATSADLRAVLEVAIQKGEAALARKGL